MIKLKYYLTINFTLLLQIFELILIYTQQYVQLTDDAQHLNSEVHDFCPKNQYWYLDYNIDAIVCTDNCAQNSLYKYADDYYRRCVDSCDPWYEAKSDQIHCPTKCTYHHKNQEKGWCPDSCQNGTVYVFKYCQQIKSVAIEISVLVALGIIALIIIIVCCKHKCEYNTCCYHVQYEKDTYKREIEMVEVQQQDNYKPLEHSIVPNQEELCELHKVIRYALKLPQSIRLQDILYGSGENHIIKDEWKQYYQPSKMIQGLGTLAMLFAENGYEIPKLWEHDPKIQDYKGRTIAMILAYNKQKIPQQWRHDPVIYNKLGRTVALTYAEKMIIPPEEWEHNPSIQNSHGYTVAMLLACQGIIPPKQWHHDPELTENEGWTVAMFIAKYCKQIPDYSWRHDPDIMNIHKVTVELYILNAGIKNYPTFWRSSSNLVVCGTNNTIQDYRKYYGVY